MASLILIGSPSGTPNMNEAGYTKYLCVEGFPVTARLSQRQLAEWG